MSESGPAWWWVVGGLRLHLSRVWASAESRVWASLQRMVHCSQPPALTALHCFPFLSAATDADANHLQIQLTNAAQNDNGSVALNGERAQRRGRRQYIQDEGPCMPVAPGRPHVPHHACFVHLACCVHHACTVHPACCVDTCVSLLHLDD